MENLRGFFADAPVWVWNLTLFGLAIAIGLLFKLIMIPVLRWKAIDQGQYSLFRSSVRHLNKVVNVLLPIIFLNTARPFMRLSPRWADIIDRAIEILFVAFAAVVIIRIIRIAEDYVNHRFDYNIPDNLKARKIRTQLQFIRKLLVTVIAIIAIAVILLSFENMQKIGAGLLTGVGLGGIVVGFAAQKSLGNLLAGFQIAFTQPIRIDDVLVVEGEWGRIEEITLTYVVVNIWDKRRLILPIQYFIDKPFQNWTRTSAEILASVFIHTDFSVPVSAIRTELTRLLKANERWDQKVNVVHVTNAKEQSMEIRALMSCRNSGDAWELQCYVREKLIEFVHQQYPRSLSRTRMQMMES